MPSGVYTLSSADVGDCTSLVQDQPGHQSSYGQLSQMVSFQRPIYIYNIIIEARMYDNKSMIIYICTHIHALELI